MSVNRPVLTIAIPTFSRAAALESQLQRLVPQLRPEVYCCVFDNGSPDATPRIANQFQDQNVHLLRAAHNAGGGRNYFRCFEECQTEWLWILCDDDPISPNAVEEILKIIATTSCDYIHISSPSLVHDRQREVTDVSTLLKCCGVGTLLWLSCGIYRRRSIEPLYRLFNDSISTMGPQLLTILSLLETCHGKALLSPAKLIDTPPKDVHWSTLDFIFHFSQAPGYLKTPLYQHLLAKGIYAEFFNMAMLHGLRETPDVDHIRNWKRIYSLSKKTLKSYGAKRDWDEIFKHSWEKGHRWKTLNTIADTMRLKLLAHCPTPFFQVLATVMPLGSTGTTAYGHRKNYIPYH